MIHLDTSFLIRALVRGTVEDRHLRSWLQESTTLGISSVCWAEFLCGPVEARDVEFVSRLFGEPVSFTAEDSVWTARLFNLGRRRRGCFADCMIAATALRSDASLATANPADFRRFVAAGLKVISR